MTARRSPIDAKLVLNRNDLNVVNVQEVGRATIRIDFLFINLESDSTRIVVAFRSIIHCPHDALTFRKFRGDGFAEISSKSGDTALTGKMIADEGYLLDGGGGDFHGARMRSDPGAFPP